jgi:hypothetical protein
MHLSNFTKGIYLFFARNLRRIADYLEVRSRSVKVESGVDKTRPSEDWLKRVEGIPPENWLEFSAEEEAESSVSAREDVTGKVLSEKQSNKRMDDASEAKDDSNLAATEIRNIKKEKSKLKTKVKKSRSSGERFLKFHSEALEKKSKIEEFNKPNNRRSKPDLKLQPTKFVSGKKNRSSEKFDFPEVKYQRKKVSSSTLKEEKKTFASKRSGSEDVTQNQKKESLSPESSKAIYKSTQNFEPSDIRQDFSISFQSEVIVQKQPKKSSRFETFSTVNSGQNKMSKNENELIDKTKKVYSQKTGNDSEINVSDVNKQFWIELPDETAYETIDEIEINRAETEHLKFLEEEQAGRSK